MVPQSLETKTVKIMERKKQQKKVKKKLIWRTAR